VWAGVEKLANLFPEQLPAGALAASPPDEVARLLRRKHSVERLLAGIGLTAGSVFVVSLMVMIVVKVIIAKGHLLQGGFLLAFTLAAAAALALVFYRETLAESLAARGVSDERARQLEGGTTTSRLLPDSRFDHVPTVTDRGTELLTAEPKGSKQ
jgi:hypothetical protein